MGVLEGLREAFRLPDLRRRILITILLLVIYRLAANIPVPGVDHSRLEQILSPETGGGISGVAQVLNLLSGGAVTNFSVLAMGVYPYITANIILTILTPLVPALEELTKEGQAGRDKLNRYTMFLAIPMAALQAVGQINLFRDSAGATIIPNFGFTPEYDVLLSVTVLVVMTAGTMFAIWLGELITQDGIGNGLSLIIFAGIVSQIPFNISQLASVEPLDVLRNLLLFAILTIITVAVIVLVQEGQRRIPVKYGKRVRGMKMYGGGTTYLPLRVNTAGMIPLIFAQSVLNFPVIIASYFTGNSVPSWLANLAQSVQTFLSQGGAEVSGQIVYWLIYFLMVVGFTYIYTDVLIRNQNLADSLQHNGGFILGIRPGKQTEQFIMKVVQRITLVGAVFLGAVAIMPGIVQIVFNVIRPGSGTELQSALLIITGGGLIIIVGVVIDTMRQMEAQLVMRHRDSFIR